MSQLDIWNKYIIDTRKSTPFREFLQTIASRYPVSFYKRNGQISIYPETDRIGGVVNPKTFEENRDQLPSLQYDPSRPFFDQFQQLFQSIQLPALIIQHLLQQIHQQLQQCTV